MNRSPHGHGPAKSLLPVALLAFLALSTPALGLEPLPQNPGWNGYLTLGVGGASLKSNSLAGSSFKEMGEPRLDSLTDAPVAVREPLPVITGQVGYFFAKSGTQILVGNVLEDLVRYDFTSRLGVHQSLGGAGLLAVDLLGSTTPALVWSDPFALDQRRQTADRKTSGARLTWDRIGGSGLEVELTGRTITIDEEESGAALSLPAARRRLLDRNGDQRQIRVSYQFDLSPDHSIQPQLTWSGFDLDGGAEANARSSLEVVWTWRNPAAVVVTSAYYGRAEFDEEHPEYGTTREDDIVGLFITAFFPKAIPGKSWFLTVNGGAYDGDSNIEFFDTRIGLAAVAVLFKF